MMLVQLVLRPAERCRPRFEWFRRDTFALDHLPDLSERDPEVFSRDKGPSPEQRLQSFDGLRISSAHALHSLHGQPSSCCFFIFFRIQVGLEIVEQLVRRFVVVTRHMVHQHEPVNIRDAWGDLRSWLVEIVLGFLALGTWQVLV